MDGLFGRREVDAPGASKLALVNLRYNARPFAEAVHSGLSVLPSDVAQSCFGKATIDEGMFYHIPAAVVNYALPNAFQRRFGDLD